MRIFIELCPAISYRVLERVLDFMFPYSWPNRSVGFGLYATENGCFHHKMFNFIIGNYPNPSSASRMCDGIVRDLFQTGVSGILRTARQAWIWHSQIVRDFSNSNDTKPHSNFHFKRLFL
ncbi:hypothetical protein LOTGIDRAFT_232414 [Lottia gigantea]|uniref:Uncharacterized protein n=1 Tax=Lottia gigantea TaxID=225164 RepID=V4BYE3_LOTGI|nr:hypothetical protein LOTGIDRAFT_232414 [Lottia gigantea]ESO94149.1 hypothetical protein LOTGIDRAFT_232414 [Lottia gigantea]